MPAKQAAPKLTAAQLLGAQASKIVAAHSRDELRNQDYTDLPGGITNGLAQLIGCRFGLFESGTNKGKPYWAAEGIVLQPETFEGVKVAGLRTRIMEPLCDTPEKKRATLEDHIDYVMNEMRKLGADTSTMKDVTELDVCAEALVAAAPIFEFSTSQGQSTPQYPNPMVFHNWRGVTSQEVEPQQDDVVDDSPKAPPIPPVKPAMKKPTKAVEPEPEAEVEAFDYENAEHEVLGEMGDTGDEAAQAELSTRADKMGISTDDYPSWAGVATAIQKYLAGEEPSPEVEPEEEWAPGVGEVYGYKPMDAKTKKPGKAIDCKITAVDTKNKSVTMVGVKNKVAYKSIPWERLENASTAE